MVQKVFISQSLSFNQQKLLLVPCGLGMALLIIAFMLQSLFGLAAGEWPIAIKAMLMSVLVAPVVEEIFFRGVVHEALLKRGVNALAAIGLVSGLFALAHMWNSSVGHALATAVPALAIGAVFHQTRRRKGLIAAVVAAVLLHSLFNALWWFGLAEQMLNYAPWLV
jgi:membrane protease YdiL (CAAX protease family)